MKNNFKRVVVALVISGVLPALSIPANAFSGGVTTVYTAPTPTTIERARTFAATTPELNQTYQRTMRTAQTAAAVATASRGIIRGLLGSLMTIATLVTLASDVHGIWTKKADGTNDLMGEAKVCSPVCYEYSITGQSTFFPTPAQACTAWLATIKDPAYTYSFVSTTTYFCTFKYASNTDGSGATDRMPVIGRELPPNTTIKPLTDEEVDAALQKNDRQLPILKTLDDLQQPVPFPSPEVEDMPQAIPISPVTTTHPDGSKTIVQTTLEPYRAGNNDIQWRKKETVTEVSKPAADGSTTTTTGTTTTDTGKTSAPDKAPEAPATDTPLPEQPKLYKQKYPDGMVGVYKTARTAMGTSPLFTMAKDLMPSVAGGGSCPTMPVNLTFASWANFGVKDVAPPCQVWDWGRAIIVVSALLLARRLVFGG